MGDTEATVYRLVGRMRFNTALSPHELKQIAASSSSPSTSSSAPSLSPPTVGTAPTPQPSSSSSSLYTPMSSGVRGPRLPTAGEDIVGALDDDSSMLSMPSFLLSALDKDPRLGAVPGDADSSALPSLPSHDASSDGDGGVGGAANGIGGGGGGDHGGRRTHHRLGPRGGSGDVVAEMGQQLHDALELNDGLRWVRTPLSLTRLCSALL